jgi:uncharacterized protein (TIGR03435 family)
MMVRFVFVAVTAAAASSILLAQTPASAGPQFDVVSIKRNVSGPATGPPNIRPDGGFTMISVPIGSLIGRAYPGNAPADMIGLPEWAMREQYDVRTTSTLTNATAEDRAAMIRAMLADRCKLAVHFEQREHDGYELVLGRKDGKLGSGLTKSDTDCSQPLPSPTGRLDMTAPPPPCTFRSVGAALRKQGSELGDLLEGDAPISRLAEALRFSLPGRQVVDKTGLTGSYRVTLNFDRMAAMRPPNATASPNDPPSVFTAIQEQLGLKLQPTRILRDTLVIDHIERPTPN